MGGEGVQRCEQLLVAAGIGVEDARRAAAPLDRRRVERPLLRAPEDAHGTVVRGVEVRRRELDGQIVEGDVVHEPGAHVAIEHGVEGPVRLPERLDRTERRLARLGPDAVDELVEIGEGGGGPLHSAAAHLRAPGEVAAQLRVGHGLVGGEVAGELSVKGEVVDVVGHKARLLHKEPRVGPRPGLSAAGERAHLADGLG